MADLKREEKLKHFIEEREKVKQLYEKYRKIRKVEREDFFNKEIKPYFEDRIKKIEHGLRGSEEVIREKFWGDQGLIKRIFSKNEGNRHGALGEIEFLERMILIEKIDIEIIPEKDEKTPDFKLIFKEGERELVTEVKSPISSQLEKISDLIVRANRKFIKSDSTLETDKTLPEEFYKIPNESQGAIEIQYFDEYASTLDKYSFNEIDREIRSAFHKDHNTHIVQVNIIRENELFLQYKRDQQNEIKQTFPHKDLEKEVAVNHENKLDGGKFQRDEKNQMEEVPHNQVSHLHELGKESDIAIVKLNLTDTEQFNLTCKYYKFEKDGQYYIAVHKNDRENESLKQLLGQNKEKNHVAKQDEPGEDFGEI